MRNKLDRGGLVLLLFFCSGASALIYEVVWSKFLSQMLGSTAYAQTVVLAVFMGGLALGNRLFGARADASPNPVRLYGLLELGIALYAVAFTTLYSLADGLFLRLGAGLLERPAHLLALKGGLSLGLLILPTTLMGGTLPLLAAWLQKNTPEAGRRSARFYSVNSLGAVCGAGLAGFVLVRSLGMVVTLQITALANALVGAIAILISRPTEPHPEGPGPSGASQAVQAGRPSLSPPRAAALVAISGGVSMGLEVLAARSLVLVFGSSLQSFAVVLMAFILGIGLGSAWVASPRANRWSPTGLTVVFLLAAGLWLGLCVCGMEQWVEWYRLARSGLARSTVGYHFHLWLTGLISTLILGVPAALIGAVLPLMIKAVSEQTDTLGAQVGRLLTWNTLGAVAGVLVTGFIFMPRLGLRLSFGLLALLLGLMAGAIAWHRRQPSGLVGAGSALAALALLFGLSGEGWRHVMSSGVFRAQEMEVDPEVMRLRKEHIRILFYEDAPDATVSVEQGDGVGAPAETGLRINGKADASSQGDLGTQLLLGHLPMLARPGAQQVFILGLGSGITAGAVSAYPIKQVTVAENCQPVVRAARYFDRWNRGVLTNPVCRIQVEDARTILKLSPQKYDVIITQPSNPWMAGIGSVFSLEFYQLAASRLKEGGLAVQWLQLYDTHDGIVSLILRTFATVFPRMEIWDCQSGDVVLLGSKSPWPSTPEQLASGFVHSQVRADLARLGIRSPEALLARQLASQQTAYAIAGDGPLQRDWFPLLEYEAPKAFFLGRGPGLLSRFDERTWQQSLAPEVKRRTLESLDASSLQSVFHEFGTVNQELWKTILFRQQLAQQTDQRTVPLEPLAPSIFLPKPDPVTAKVSAAALPPPELARLLTSGVRLDPAALEGVLARVEALLRDAHPPEGWRPGAVGPAAVRASLGAGRPDLAMALLSRGLQATPDNPQLLYLARVLARVQLTHAPGRFSRSGAPVSAAPATRPL